MPTIAIVDGILILLYFNDLIFMREFASSTFDPR